MPDETQAITKVNGGGSVNRQGFGEQEVQRSGDTAVAALVAREEAIIKSQYVMAERHPRIWDDVRLRLLKHMDRSEFADKAWYMKLAGKKKTDEINSAGQPVWEETFAEGWTIRFAETAAQECRNMKLTSEPTYEDDNLRIVRVGVLDLENNLPWEKSISIPKAVEKRGYKKQNGSVDPPAGREVLATRQNVTTGDTVFLVRATDDEMQMREAALTAKVWRNFIIKLIPSDILSDCNARRIKNAKEQYRRDPNAVKKVVLDRFNDLGLKPSELIAYIGRSSDVWTEDDLIELKALGQAIAEHEITFADAMRSRYGSVDENGRPEGSAEATKKALDDRMEKLRAKDAERKAAAEAAAQPIPQPVADPVHQDGPVSDDFPPEPPTRRPFAGGRR